MLSRRQFLLRSGSAGAAVILAPQTALESLGRRARRRNAARRAVPPGRPVRRPDARRHHAAHPARRRRGARARRARGRDRPPFRKVVARKTIATSAAQGYSVKARVKGLKPHERYYYRFETETSHSPVGRFQTALPADSERAGALRVLLLRGLHARLLQRLRAAGARGRRLRRLPRRLHLRRELPRQGQDRRARRQDRQGPTPRQPVDRARGRSRSPTTAPSTRSIAPTRPCATCTRSSR